MANEVAKLIYKGLKANLPENRNAGSEIGRAHV